MCTFDGTPLNITITEALTQESKRSVFILLILVFLLKITNFLSEQGDRRHRSYSLRIMLI